MPESTSLGAALAGVDARIHLAGRAEGQLRKSGDAYVTHPVAVAAILVGMGADDPTLCAGLLQGGIGRLAVTLHSGRPSGSRWGARVSRWRTRR